MTGTVARTLGDFCSHVEFADVPEEVRQAARWHLLDTLGVCIAGSGPGDPGGEALRRVTGRWHDGSARSVVLGTGLGCRPEAAALLNGALAQSLEMDDKHGPSLARPGSSVTPAALAVGQDRDLPVEEVVSAIVVGYEVMIRLGLVAGDGFLRRGYHTSSLLGVFGAAAAVGRLLRCDATKIVDALGIAGSFAGGIQEPTRTGSTSKILHGGWGAHSGVLAVDLALGGLTGPDSVFEGQYGFFRSHLTPTEAELDWEVAVRSLGDRWYLPETAFKPYPCCELLHAFIEAGRKLRAHLASDGVPVPEIDELSCQLAEPGLTLVTQPVASKRAPEHPHEARFSLPFVLASTVVKGDIGTESFTAAALEDPDVLALAARVRSAEDPCSDYPLHYPARLEAVAGSKRYSYHVPYHPGCPEAPMSEDAVLSKFAENTSWFLGPDAAGIGARLVAP
ncbi:MAG: MmgE/PrpD family protein, partial [Acidimicrobiaceae bacterium]|nr:MmgE/PrpD family protein [Acidimicrobiaceae bacterium]